MRASLPFLVVAACIGLQQSWFACERAGASALSEEARLAIELRCSPQPARAAAECRSVLARVFRSGSLDPDKTLRSYCDSIRTARWGGTLPPPPRVCVERYGGWREG